MILPRVDVGLVAWELLLVSEGFPAGRASVRFLARVNPLMFNQFGIDVESSATLGAFVGLLPRMDSLVLDEG